MNFDIFKYIEDKESVDMFLNGVYTYSYTQMLEKYPQRKDKIKLAKMWFDMGKVLYVNGSARGRLVLKYSVELRYLLKTGYIEQYRAPNGGKSRQTVLIKKEK